MRTVKTLTLAEANLVLDAAQAKAEAEQASGPYKMADRLVYDDIIEPAELRDRILEGLELARSR